MAITINLQKRNIIPRWRSYRKSNIANEQKSLDIGTVKQNNVRYDYEEALWAYNKYKTIFAANELLSIAELNQESNKYKDVAEFILKNKNSTHYSIKLAKKILGIKNLENNDNNTNLFDNNKIRRDRISKMRLLIKNNPHNPLYWLELAREYTIIGKIEKAKKAINYAYYLSNGNRYILRSIARYYIHKGEADIAQSILSKNEAISYDPWLLSVEISSNTILERSSKLIKIANNLIKSNNYSNFELSELYSALAMTEKMFGAYRKSNQLFRKSILNPTENALAQYIWNIREQGQEINDISDQFPLYSYEAKAYGKAENQEYNEAIDETNNWFNDQPFSKKPPEFGSYISGIICDYEKGKEFCERGLNSNSSDTSLLNNLAFFLSSQGKVGEAEKVFKKINYNEADDSLKIVLTATQGLIYYRNGDFAKGKSLYLNAIDNAKQKGKIELATRALIYLTREEKLINSGEIYKYENEVEDSIKKITLYKKDIQTLWNNIKNNVLKKK